MKITYSTCLLSLCAVLLGSCNRSHQLGMEETPQELLEMKLANPERELTATQSIVLLDHCAKFGFHF